MKKLLTVLMAGAAATFLVAGCGSTNSANDDNQAAAAAQLGDYNKSQPVHSYPHSQLRQNLQEIEDAQASGALSTSFFWNLGVDHPVMSCPSIGFPIPTTDQLTNPSQVQWGNNSASGVVGQIENTGVYTGDSTGTYVICSEANGAVYPQYWEGYVQTVGAPAHYDPATKAVVLDGTPTIKVTK
jgi:hypothetical protein